MKPILHERPSRTSWEEGASLFPYLIVFQRVHARRWLMAAAVATSAGLLAFLLAGHHRGRS